LRHQQHARQGARVLIDIGVLGAGDLDEVAGLQALIDLLDGHAGRDEAQAEHVGEQRAVARHQRRESALVGQRDMVLGAGRLAVEAEPQRVVAKRVVELVDEAGIGPVEVDAGELDAVAPVGAAVRAVSRFKSAIVSLRAVLRSTS
jgi:hypothetical protein